MKKIACFVLLGLSMQASAGKPPANYVESSATEKRNFHVHQGQETAHGNKLPSVFWGNCVSHIALAGAFFPGYMRRTLNSPSGYPTDLWRQWLGKAVHKFGVMAPGSVELTERVIGLDPGTYPVTYRFSTANVFNGKNGFRPGLLIIFHLDGKDDVNLFTMPEAGLSGFEQEINPFTVTYTHWLNQPTGILKTVGELTFGRVTRDFITQFAGPDRLENRRGEVPDRNPEWQIYLKPRGPLATAYEDTSGDFRRRFMALNVEEGRTTPLFELSRGEKDSQTIIGRANIEGPWISSNHSDMWFARHEGFVLK